MKYEKEQTPESTYVITDNRIDNAVSEETPPTADDAYAWACKALAKSADEILCLNRQLEEAHTSRDALIKDRADLLDQTQKGPLSANEWQIRAIRAERQLAEARKDTERLDWLVCRISGKEFRRIGITYDDVSVIREAIDAAREGK